MFITIKSGLSETTIRLSDIAIRRTAIDCKNMIRICIPLTV